ncbi:hypothetical protein, variant [Fonticula alba]|uniref:Uncharacterized protein n=1 Tax=Fonticula alba TaxID=691883 RepID=A0A058ZB92_FONAL|nr:hypothetical protein, variant [Fonticula alba]KCV71201.1 hypothetical protein, variant [Fonticula alba]|eukprot:XP_009494323.1 hypothetical protein, variant [Fonticula alba]
MLTAPEAGLPQNSKSRKAGLSSLVSLLEWCMYDPLLHPTSRKAFLTDLPPPALSTVVLRGMNFSLQQMTGTGKLLEDQVRSYTSLRHLSFSQSRIINGSEIFSQILNSVLPMLHLVELPERESYSLHRALHNMRDSLSAPHFLVVPQSSIIGKPAVIRAINSILTAKFLHHTSLRNILVLGDQSDLVEWQSSLIKTWQRIPDANRPEYLQHLPAHPVVGSAAQAVHFLPGAASPLPWSLSCFAQHGPVTEDTTAAPADQTASFHFAGPLEQTVNQHLLAGRRTAGFFAGLLAPLVSKAIVDRKFLELQPGEKPPPPATIQTQWDHYQEVQSANLYLAWYSASRDHQNSSHPEKDLSHGPSINGLHAGPLSAEHVALVQDALLANQAAAFVTQRGIKRLTVDQFNLLVRFMLPDLAPLARSSGAVSCSAGDRAAGDAVANDGGDAGLPAEAPSPDVATSVLRLRTDYSLSNLLHRISALEILVDGNGQPARMDHVLELVIRLRLLAAPGTTPPDSTSFIHWTQHQVHAWLHLLPAELTEPLMVQGVLNEHITPKNGMQLLALANAIHHISGEKLFLRGLPSTSSRCGPYPQALSTLLGLSVSHEGAISVEGDPENLSHTGISSAVLSLLNANATSPIYSVPSWVSSLDLNKPLATLIYSPLPAPPTTSS